MRHEAAGVATSWYDLGLELLDSNTAVHVLDVIQSDNQSDNARCCSKILMLGLRQNLMPVGVN